MKYFILILLLTFSIFAEDTVLAEALAQSGKVHAAGGRSKQAVVEFYKALANDPNCVTALFELAKIEEISGDKSTAAEFYRKAFVFSPAGSVRSQAQARYYALNPIAERAIVALKEYSRDIELLCKSKQDNQYLLRRCDDTVFSLDMKSYLTSKDMPKIHSDNSINLIPLIKSRPEIIPNGWEVCGQTIRSSAGKEKLQIPYSPPESYTFYVEFMFLDHDGVVGIIVPTKSGGVSQLWYYSPDRVGLAGKPDMTPPEIVKVGSKGTLSLKVSGSHIEAMLNGKAVCSTDRPSPAAEWTLKDKLSLGFGSHGCRVEFISVGIVEPSGHGTILK